MCFVPNLRYGRSIKTTEREFEIKLESEITKKRYEDSFHQTNQNYKRTFLSNVFTNE